MKIVEVANYMELKWLGGESILPTEEPLIIAIAIDESHAVIGLLDEGVEHAVMLRKVLGTDKDIDKYYRIVVDEDGADWTFVCPVDYKNIANKEKRIHTFYNDGIDAIVKLLRQIGYPEEITIPNKIKNCLKRWK
jgi:hypothetical protein